MKALLLLRLIRSASAFPKHYVYNLKEPAQYPFEIRENSPWSPSDFETEKLEKAPRNMFGGIDA